MPKPDPAPSPVSESPPASVAASHDVLIVGGGLVGASLAIALDGLGLDTALLEAASPGALPAVFDQRNLSLAEATVNALRALDVLPRLRTPTGPIARIHISRSGDFGRVLLEAADHGRAAFGHVVVARDFGDALESKLGDLPRLTRHRPARFLGFAEDGADGLRRARVADGDGDSERVIAAKLVVAADGAASAVRDALGIAAEQHDYHQTLFVARVRSERAPDGTAWERLTDHGPTAVLPRGDGHYGVIHGVARDEADAVAALDDAAYLQRLQRAFGWRAGRFLSVGPRSRYPIARTLAQRLVAPRAVLVGNAAQSLHPIGAQGFNLGLRDALTLVECIEAGHARGEDIGSEAMLAEYAQRRREDRERTIAFSDGLARLTSNPSSLVSPLRSLGLFALDHDAALRAQVVAGAMGYRGDTPQLCREVAA
ncbi:MAG: 2-octaprenyl-6-methoxyphenyl hydroxylase [Xanthomonadales bacterium]|nr:2-octaprenyl-6-methoxyphenyl hydroxylase [Xanthomonadales bacterium]